MVKYLVFDIENQQPIKIANTLMQVDNEFTKSYISGASIRGAYIANYINIKKVKSINQGEHKYKLLTGGIEFLNAYPVIEGRRAFPLPKCFYALKDDMKKYPIEKKMDINMIREDSEDDYQKIKNIEFINVNFDSKVLETRNVEKVNNVHIRKDTKNSIFRYEAIAPHNKFKGIIKINKEEYVEEVKEILEQGVFYIGGSKGSGYGKCTISNILETSQNPEEIAFLEGYDENDYEYSEFLSFYATSDIIYRNNLGMYKTFIDEEFIKDKLNLNKIELYSSHIETECFSGFNNKWGYKLPLVNGIKAGSIITYKIEGEIELDKIKLFIDEGIGERKEDGFGRFLLIPDIEDNFNFKRIEKNREYSCEEKEIILKDKEEKEQLKIILNRIYLSKLNKDIPKKVLGFQDSVSGHLNKNQIGKLTNLMDILQGLNKEDGIARLEDYFNHIEKAKLNRELANALTSVNINNRELKDFLLYELKDSDIKNFQIRYLNYISLGGVESKLPNESQSIYEYKLKLFKELFRLQLKE